MKERLNDLEIWKALHKLADDVDALGKRALSPATQTACEAAARAIRRVTKALLMLIEK